MSDALWGFLGIIIGAIIGSIGTISNHISQYKQLKKLWRSPYVQLYCCGCYNKLRREEVELEMLKKVKEELNKNVKRRTKNKNKK